jgi:hypothetical protein
MAAVGWLDASFTVNGTDAPSSLFGKGGKNLKAYRDPAGNPQAREVRGELQVYTRVLLNRAEIIQA